MGRLAVIGELTAVTGYQLVGALVLPADDDAAVHAAWASLPDDVEVVILSAAAAPAVADVRTDRSAPLRVVMPS